MPLMGKIPDMLVDQLDGNFKIENDKGAKNTLEFIV
jgi:two-component sensor histidine kinase